MKCTIGEHTGEVCKLSAGLGPPETNIINKSKCNMSIYIVIKDYITKFEILFTYLMVH